MSASKKDELLRNLTRKDAQKPPMDVTYENKGLVLEQLIERSTDEGTQRIDDTNISDSSNAQKSTVNVNDAIIVNKSTKHDSHTSNKQMDTTHEDGTNVVNKNTTNEHDTSNARIDTTQELETINEQMNCTHVYDTNNVHMKSTHTNEYGNSDGESAGDQPEVGGEEVAATTVLQSFKQAMRRETVEDTHTRKTFIVRNDLLRELDKLSKKQGRGFQTWFINTAFEMLIDEIKSAEKKPRG